MRIAFSLLMILLLFLLPQQSSQAAREAIRIWGTDVIPSLFPYMVLCKMLAARLQASRMPAVITASFLGLLGGSPSGAAVLSAYAENGKLDLKQLPSLCALTGTISPMFLLHTLNTWFASPNFCRKMLLAHLLGAAISAAIIRVMQPVLQTDETMSKKASTHSTSDPIGQSVYAVLNVGGCIVFYSVLSTGLNAALLRFTGVSGVIHAILEIAGGMRALSASNPSPVCCAALAGFGGLSILSQNLSFLRPYGIRFPTLLGISALRAFSCGCVMWLIGVVFN